ncbi:MAG TPA: hypothetical protein VLX29_08750 [Nitrospirota bacterium]|nr:hypothetical protein [Nitrospirota bacterium]
MCLNNEFKRFTYPFFVATFLVILSFWFEARVGLNLGDEGFLWYGAQATLNGAVPMRDFMSYDPGRYYWSAFFMWAMQDNGIVALRIAIAIFQWIGLCIALWAVYKFDKRKWLVVVAGLLFILWMFPRHKLFDISLAIILTVTAACLIESPVRQRYFWAGLILGLAAFFGRNHGLYGAVGLGGAMVLNQVTRRGPGIVLAGRSFLPGLVIGYSPMIVMLIFVPNFFQSFIEGIRFLFEINSTNIQLPVPWPWMARSAKDFVEGLFFIALLVFPVIGGIKLWQRRNISSGNSPLLAAAVLLSIPYAHFAFSRAGIGHLAQGIGPMMLGSVTLHSNLTDRKRLKIAAFLLCLVVLSYIVVSKQHPGLFASTYAWQKMDIAGDILLLDKDTSILVHTAKRLITENHGAVESGSVLITPFWPGLYPVLGLKSPVWEIYALFPRKKSFQDMEINRIQVANTRMVILADIALDGREELRFKSTHPVIYDFIRKNYRPLTIENSPEYLKVFIH